MVRLGHESRSSVSDLVHTQYDEKNSWKKHSGLTKDNEPSSDLKKEILKTSVCDCAGDEHRATPRMQKDLLLTILPPK